MTDPVALARDLRKELGPHHWLDQAVCSQVDPELFFPPHGGKNRAKNARRICAECPVRLQCLEWALSLDEAPEGVWGGLTLEERTRLMEGVA